MRAIRDGDFLKIKALANAIDKGLADFDGSIQDTETLQSLAEMLVDFIEKASKSDRKEIVYGAADEDKDYRIRAY